METNNQEQSVPKPEVISTEAVLLEILEHTRKTKKYMQWQLYITIALVVIPLIGAMVMIPLVLRSVSSVYQSGIIQ